MKVFNAYVSIQKKFNFKYLVLKIIETSVFTFTSKITC